MTELDMMMRKYPAPDAETERRWLEEIEKRTGFTNNDFLVIISIPVSWFVAIIIGVSFSPLAGALIAILTLLFFVLWVAFDVIRINKL